MTHLFGQAVLMLGEIGCGSLVGLKELRVCHAFLPHTGEDYVTSRLHGGLIHIVTRQIKYFRLSFYRWRLILYSNKQIKSQRNVLNVWQSFWLDKCPYEKEKLYFAASTHTIFINYKKSSIDYGMRHKVGHGVCQRKICCTCMIKILLKVRSLTVEKHLVLRNSGSERLVSNFYTRF